MKHFDAIIIGTDQAGPPLAARFAGAGKTVAIIERHKFGGTCVNTGCTPTKTWQAPMRSTLPAEARNMVSPLMICASIAKLGPFA
jgi:pyruvate/2-oxoglutarate dehydrogenase complex dihydrolipoamide dehydrogenase (E3) component